MTGEFFARAVGLPARRPSLVDEVRGQMLYAILCYNLEDVVGSWTPVEDAAVMARLGAVEQNLALAGRLGPVARLLPTTAAVTLRKGRETMVIDGPFAETKEQLLGFYVVECEGLEAAIDVARALAVANPDRGAYEIRPVDVYRPGGLPGVPILRRAVRADA